MTIKESDLISVNASDVSSSDKVRLLVSDASRVITVERFCEAIQSELEGLGFVTTSSTPSNFTQTRKILSTTTDHTLSLTDSVILCDTSIANITISLPSAASAWSYLNSSSQQFTIKKTTADANPVYVDGFGGDLVEGLGTHTIAGGSKGSITIVSDGNNWHIVG